MHATELNCAQKGQLHIGPQKGQNSRRQLGDLGENFLDFATVALSFVCDKIVQS